MTYYDWKTKEDRLGSYTRVYLFLGAWFLLLVTLVGMWAYAEWKIVPMVDAEVTQTNK